MEYLGRREKILDFIVDILEVPFYLIVGVGSSVLFLFFVFVATASLLQIFFDIKFF